MLIRTSRRKFLASTVAVSASAFASSLPLWASSNGHASARAKSSPFRIAVINDEIGQDFDRVCSIVSNDFGLEWIELRGMWNKNVVNLDSKEIAEAQKILAKYKLRVTDIASPLFKTDWPGAPKSKFSPKSPQFGADFSFDQQDDVLDRSLELAKAFQTDRVRCFDFWRLDDQAPHRAAINAKLLEAAIKAREHNVILLLENEMTCNTATGAEAAKVLAAVQSPHFMLNWDPGNATASGEKAYPDGYEILPKDRVGHCHCKDVVKMGKEEWAAMGQGVIDWVGQFKSLKRDGYHFAVSLETHWRGAKTPEASTRQSWAGMKDELQKAGAL
jgi:sugar phosphate isomerase/epimerase